MEQLQAQAINSLQIILGALLSAVTALVLVYIQKGTTYLKTKTNAINDDQAKKIVNETLDKTDELLKTYIISFENTMKPQIVQSIADGKVDKSELNSLATLAKEATIKQLGDGGMKILNDALGDANSYLENRLEKILAELKSDEGTAVNKTVIPAVTTTEGA